MSRRVGRSRSNWSRIGATVVVVVVVVAIVGVPAVRAASPAGAAPGYWFVDWDPSTGTVSVSQASGLSSALACWGDQFSPTGGGDPSFTVPCDQIRRVEFSGWTNNIVLYDELDGGSLAPGAVVDFGAVDIFTSSGTVRETGTTRIWWLSLPGDTNDAITLIGSSPGVGVDVGGRDPRRVLATSTATSMTMSVDETAITVPTPSTYSARTVEVRGGDGNDVIDGSGLRATDRLLAAGKGGSDTIIGGPGEDELVGDGPESCDRYAPGDDRLEGRGGADLLKSTDPGTCEPWWDGGRDSYVGGPGDDTIVTGRGPELVDGGPGSDAATVPYGWRTTTVTGVERGLTVDAGRFGETTRLRPVLRSAIRLQHTGPEAVSIVAPGADAAPLTGRLGAARTATDRRLVDLRPLTAAPQQWTGSATAIADIVAPPGSSWTTSGSTTTVNVPGPADMTLTLFGAVEVHEPFATASASYVHRATRDLLFRFLTDEQRTADAAALDSSEITTIAYATQLVEGEEHLGIEVDREYLRFLDRVPDDGGKAYWVGRLGAGLSFRRLRAALLGSDEFFSQAASGDVDRFVRQAYTRVLGRQPDPGGAAYWADRIRTGSSARWSVALAFLSTPEARGMVVRQQFVRLLQRAPSDAEMARWSDVLRSHSRGEQELLIALVSSPEYRALE